MDSINLSSSSNTVNGTEILKENDKKKEEEIKELTVEEISVADKNNDGIITESEFKSTFGNVSSDLLMSCIQKYNSAKAIENSTKISPEEAAKQKKEAEDKKKETAEKESVDQSEKYVQSSGLYYQAAMQNTEERKAEKKDDDDSADDIVAGIDEE